MAVREYGQPVRHSLSRKFPPGLRQDTLPASSQRKAHRIASICESCLAEFLKIRPCISSLWQRGHQQRFPHPTSHGGGRLGFLGILTSSQERQDGNEQHSRATVQVRVSVSPLEHTRKWQGRRWNRVERGKLLRKEHILATTEEILIRTNQYKKQPYLQVSTRTWQGKFQL